MREQAGHEPRLLPVRAIRSVRAGLLVIAVAYALPLLPVPERVLTWPEGWNDWLLVVLTGACSLVCLGRAVLVRRDRVAWACFALGLAAYTAGSVALWAEYRFAGEKSYPSAADAGWLLLYPPLIAGILLLSRSRAGLRAGPAALDGVISGIGLASLSAAFVFPAVTAGATSPDTAATLTTYAYPVLDLLLLAAAIGSIAALDAWRQPSWLLLTAGCVASAGTDTWYLWQISHGTYTAGGPLDAAYLAGPVLLALGATVGHDGPAPRDGLPGDRSFLVPGVFALVALAVLTVSGHVEISDLGLGLAVLALVAAFARTALSVREVVRLSDSRRLALTDALTGLPNRRALLDLLDRAESAPSAGRASVVLADLDRFKEINDGLGHSVGDGVLRAVSERLAALVPPGGTLARLGGDELALFLPGVGTADAARLCRRMTDALAGPFRIEDVTLHVDASFGVAEVEAGGAGRSLAKADLAMYRAKASRAGWEVYDDERDGDAWDRLATVEALRSSLADDGFTVEFQPIVHRDGMEPAALEALVRWDHPTRGRVPPDVFLPMVERAGLMQALTRTVLDLALDEAVELRRLGVPVPVAVNLSASDLLDDGLVEHVAAALARRGLPAAALKLELTESLLVDSGGGAEFLLGLRDLGVPLAVDDYGTGYSCLAYLHDLPLAILKIDRAFTTRVLTDERTGIIVDSTIDMAHRLGLRVVAEGVETAEQAEWLGRHGCDLLQGWHVGRPMPPDRLHAWLAERTPVA